VIWRGRWAADPGASAPVADDEWASLLTADPQAGWRRFIDAYTPVLLAHIERAGIVDRDEAMEIYTHVCERLSDQQCAALRRRDPLAGSLRGWLAVVVRRAVVDYVRSQIGRRRIFGAVRALDRFHQRLFELYYWEGRPLAEATELLRAEMKRDVSLETVLDALETVDAALSERHRGELLSMVARSRAPLSLDGAADTMVVEPVSDAPDPEAALRARELEDRLNRALAALPPEDAAIVSLKYIEGLTRTQIQRLLRLPDLTEHRVRTIVATLRSLLDAERSAAVPPSRAMNADARSSNV
jgi:RNA polymerase sigma factor (sigma-70 family)